MTDPIRPVNDDYSSAGQLTPEQIRQAAQQGFQAVLNLRSPHEPGTLPDEAEQAAAAGLGYAQAPVSPTTPEGDPLNAALAALDGLPKPVLIHCRGGGRATAVALIAIANQEKLSRDAFLEQASAHGLGPEQPQIQQFLRDYYGAPVPDQQEVG
ncbi:sulfur transferase domain-containing protein [Nodosilinea sp. FACHB-13]|uniref:beta-lactamase hydrolase domain-containing protein n=1 Tax=Cyanophyceae TaxID=3028117 RepID=UPI0016859209|nr:sulfur transferase domain-containing protein [Nodosilinea sp. FACHB-13]MBD2108298.1 phosphatase [Nodosilinea sp. FACHB-13]